MTAVTVCPLDSVTALTDRCLPDMLGFCWDAACACLSCSLGSVLNTVLWLTLFYLPYFQYVLTFLSCLTTM